MVIEGRRSYKGQTEIALFIVSFQHFGMRMAQAELCTKCKWSKPKQHRHLWKDTICLKKIWI